MRNIQDVGSEILNNKPNNIYIFTGNEYGIKYMYIKHLIEYYGGYKEIFSMNEFISFMSTKHIIPLKPTLYILRYDEEFLSSLSNSTEKLIDNVNIIGTVVLLYESEKHCSKVEKFLGNYCVRMDAVNNKYIKKYLLREYGDSVNPSVIEWISKFPITYNRCRMICESLKYYNFGNINGNDLLQTFGVDLYSSDDAIKICIASKNIIRLYDEISKYSSDKINIMYLVLSTMLEIEKCKISKSYNSILREYSSNWKLEDVYNLFMITYEQISRLRSYTSDVDNSLLHIISFIGFSNIPDEGVFNGTSMSS